MIINKIKKAVLVGILMMYMVSMQVSAAIDSEVRVRDYTTENGRLNLFLGQGSNVQIIPNAENIKVEIEGQLITPDMVTAMNETEEKTAVVCLVDVSGSLDQERINAEKQIINEIVDEKNADDVFNIITVADSVNQSGFLNNSDEIKTFVESIQVTAEDTNLYFAIKESIKILSEQDVNSRILMIFSDGAEDQETGITREEAIRVIDESFIPVYTVAMVNQNPSEKEIESAKILGSFSRSSLGGVHYAPIIDDAIRAELIPQMIQESLKKNYIVSMDISDLVINNEKVKIAVSVDGGESGILSTETEVEGKVLKQSIDAVVVVDTPVTTVETKTEAANTIDITTEKLPTTTEEKGIQPYIFFIVIGLIFVIIVAIIAVVIRNRRKNVTEENNDEENYVLIPKPFPAESIPIPDEEVKVQKGVKITLTRMGKNEDAAFEFLLDKKAVLGRDEIRADISIPLDSLLSREHCTFSRKEHQLFLKDNESSNGTLVNGIPLNQEIILEKDDIILVGNYEYRVSWEDDL